jgi:hypothetical protein
MKEINKPANLDELLLSIENIKVAEIRPFFYSRLISRMNDRKSQQRTVLFKPSYVIATLLILLIINFQMVNLENKTQEQEETANNSISQFAETYNLNVTSY